ncbi:MAG: hypothetical protein RL748_1305 [Pseudomonadota bacterium]|jgi:urease accessory protein
MKALDLPIAFTPWQASLRLGFARMGERTALVQREHNGPLRVQKALYPEGQALCQAIIVHPPGGVVAGDQLQIAVEIGIGSQVLLTTPGAAKWYKSPGPVSGQDIVIKVAEGATLEWLPQETIFFDACQVALNQQIELAQHASYIGCDIVCYGRRASGEALRSGRISQRTRISRAGKLIWSEQGICDVAQADSRLHSRFGMAGNTVCATLLACPATAATELANGSASRAANSLSNKQSSSLLADLRSAIASLPGCGVTHFQGMWVVRYLGHSSEDARQTMLAAWAILRPALLGRAAVVPRIWQT